MQITRSSQYLLVLSLFIASIFSWSCKHVPDNETLSQNAFKLIELTANGGDGRLIFLKGYFYHEGIGVEKNPAEAKRLWIQARSDAAYLYKDAEGWLDKFYPQWRKEAKR